MLIVAAENGNLDCVKVLLKYNADIENRCNDDDPDGNTPLFRAACSRGHVNVLRYLVENGADVNALLYENRTPLMLAILCGHLNAATFLMEHGADVNIHDNDGKTAVHYVVDKFSDSRDVLSCLVKHGADVNVLSKNVTPLMSASARGKVNAATFLVEHGANVDLQSKHGDTALHYAARHPIQGTPKIARILLSHGASQLYNNERLTPLLLACSGRRSKLVESFMKRLDLTKEQRIDALELLGASLVTDEFRRFVIRKTKITERAFHYIKRGMEERFQYPSYPVLKQPVEPVEAYQNRKESQTLEELAQIEGDVDAIVMESLVIRERILGSDSRQHLFEVESSLGSIGVKYQRSGNFDICIKLYSHAIKIGQHHNQSTLGLKAIGYLIWALYDMIEHNIPPRQNVVLEVLQKTVLEMRFTKERKLEAESLKKFQESESKLLCYMLRILQIFAKFELCDEDKKSSITIIIQRLLCANLQNDHRNTLLHLAADGQGLMVNFFRFELKNRLLFAFPCPKTVKLLLHMGFDVNAVNSNGDTPLHRAVTFQPSNDNIHLLTEMLEVLLDGGVHHDFVNNDGKTPMDMAQTDEACWILSERKTLELKCIAAKAVKKFGLPYAGVVPKSLEKYISMH